MKKAGLIVFFIMMFFVVSITLVQAQCSICTKTASQLGTKAAGGLNTGIVYLMLAPFTIVGYIGFRWWQAEKAENADIE